MYPNPQVLILEGGTRFHEACYCLEAVSLLLYE